MDPQGSLARVGRDGTLSLRFERRGASTALVGCRFTLPLQVLTPLALDGAVPPEARLYAPEARLYAPEARPCAPEAHPCAPEARPCVVSMLNPTGSVLGGDHLRIEARAASGAHALLTTPSATRIHRTDGPPATQDVTLTVAPGAVMEWVPDHTIPYAGSAYRQRIQAHVAADATLILVDAFAAGRVARNERWRFTRLESAVQVMDDAGWLLHDRFVLTGDAAWEGLGFSEGAPYLATIVAVTAGEVEGVVRAAGEALRVAAGVRGGVGRLPRRGILTRCLAETAPALGAAVDAVWKAVRAAAVGATPLDLRKY